jgi:Transposase DDE domain
VDNVADENWKILLGLFPDGWQQQAVLSGALERLRGFASADDLLRTLLMHVGKGYSLRETAVRARAAGIAQVSDVALLKRLRKAEDWWHGLCEALLRESGWEMRVDARGWRIRALDGTLVKGPGKAGALWRIHYSLQIPSLICDYLQLKPVRGRGNGEVLERFPAAPGDLLLADRAFAKPVGVEVLHRQGAAVVVRLNTASLPLWATQKEAFPLLEELRGLKEPDSVQQWEVWVRGPTQWVPGRLCAVRKSEEATRRAQRKIRRKAQLSRSKTKPETLVYAAYVLVFTSLPSEQFGCAEVLELYRLRWQIELVFKRLKSLAELGHLPTHDPQSSRAWLYGKLLLALLDQKLNRIGRAISPWGYRLSPTRA